MSDSLGSGPWATVVREIKEATPEIKMTSTPTLSIESINFGGR